MTNYMGRTLHQVGISWYDVTGIAPTHVPALGTVYYGARLLGTSLAAAKRAVKKGR